MLLLKVGSSGMVLESRISGNRLLYVPAAAAAPRKAAVSVHCSINREVEDGSGMGGDPRIQRALVEMIQIQVSKARVSEFMDERSRNLRNIAENSRHEYDRIAYRAMKKLDARGSRLLRDVEAGVGAIEQELKLARAEMEAQSKAIVESQIWTARSRNEGLFFKTLYTDVPKPTKDLVVSSPSGSFSASYKQFLSGGISLVLASFVYSSGSALLTGTFLKPWKLASYGIILTILLTQMAYVEVLVGDKSIDVVPQDVPQSSLPTSKNTDEEELP